MSRFHCRVWVSLSAVATLVGCGSADPIGFAPGREGAELACSIPTSLLFDTGVGRDGIPALSDPLMVDATDPSVERYLRDGSRVIGIRIGTAYVAIPHNVLWWHEVVNLDVESVQVAVTYCPLTGSGLVFDRGSVGGAELGVSGLLFQNNLVLYDRRDGSSLFPQMMREAACGPGIGRGLRMYPSQEMTWEAWKRLHPGTAVLSPETGHARDYTRYPYGSYEDLADYETLYPQELDTSRPPKERVLGLPDGAGGGVAFPFEELRDVERPLRVVRAAQPSGDVLVLWDAHAESAVAFHAELDGADVDLVVAGERFVDEGTGSIWSLEGTATEGSRQGARLRPVDDAFVSFWFAWKAFQPATTVWSAAR